MKLQVAALFCSVIGALLYINTLDCGYCFDDHSAVELNPDLWPQTPWRRLLENDFWGTPMSSRISHKSYRPLTVATFKLNYMLHELQPLGYHLVNVLLHSAVCYLYVLLCGVVFSEVWPALIAGLLFAVHPIHTEAIAGIVGRAELLSSIFYILAFFCYKRATQRPGHTSVKWLCGVFLSVLCSALSKEQGITAVAVCLAYDVLYSVQIDMASLLQFKLKLVQNDKGKSEERHIVLTPPVKAFIMRATLLSLFTIAFMVFRIQMMGGGMPTFYLEETNPAVLQPTPFRQLYWLYLCFSNIWLLLSPSTLCADWANGSVPLILSIVDRRNLSTLLLFSTITMLLMIAMKKDNKKFIFALSLLVLPYLPASNLFFPVGFVVAERVLYLPSMGFCMLVSIIYQELMTRGRKWMRFLKPMLFLILIVHSAKTVRRNRDWYSEATLWSSAVPVNPNNAKVFTNLAKGYEKVNDTDMTLAILQHALKLQPNVMLQWMNVARVFKLQGRSEEAEEHFRGALALVPKGKKMTLNVGNEVVNVYGDLANLIKTNTSRLGEAAALFSKAASLEVKRSKIAYWSMEAGNCYLQLEDFERSRNAFLSAFQTDPDSADTNYNLAVSYGKEGDLEMAEKYIHRTLTINRNHYAAVNSLASILSDSEDNKRQEEAFRLHERASQLNPSDYKPLWRAGKLHLKRNEFKEAETYLLQALHMSPASPQVLYSLGKLYSALEKYSNAIHVLEKMVTVMPNSKLGATLLAEAYRHMGSLEKAKELDGTREDVSVSGTSVKAFLSVAREQVSQKNFDLAENYFREALKKDNSSVTVLAEFGTFLAQRNKCSEAVLYLSSALEMLESGRTMNKKEREFRESIVVELQNCAQRVHPEQEREGGEKNGKMKNYSSTKYLRRSPISSEDGLQDVNVREQVADEDMSQLELHTT